MNDFLVISLAALGIALISALILRKSGYSFSRSLISSFLAAAAVLSLLYKLLREYL